MSFQSHFVNISGQEKRAFSAALTTQKSNHFKKRCIELNQEPIFSY